MYSIGRSGLFGRVAIVGNCRRCACRVAGVPARTRSLMAEWVAPSARTVGAVTAKGQA